MGIFTNYQLVQDFWTINSIITVHVQDGGIAINQLTAKLSPKTLHSAERKRKSWHEMRFPQD